MPAPRREGDPARKPRLTYQEEMAAIGAHTEKIKGIAEDITSGRIYSKDSARVEQNKKLKADMKNEIKMENRWGK